MPRELEDRVNTGQNQTDGGRQDEGHGTFSRKMELCSCQFRQLALQDEDQDRVNDPCEADGGNGPGGVSPEET